MIRYRLNLKTVYSRRRKVADWVGLAVPPAAMKVVTFAGNATGIYSVPGMLSTSSLLVGFTTQAVLSGTVFNSSPAPFFLASNLVNPTHGWKPSLNTITDPTAANWTGWGIVWVWQ